MRCSRALILLCVCVCALGDQSPSLSSYNSTDPSTRPVETEPMLDQLLNIWRTCMRPPTPDGPPVTLCSSLDSMHRCFSEQETAWNQTHSETLNKVFVIYRELWETTVARLCANQGEKYSALMKQYAHVLEDLGGGDNPFAMNCLFLSSTALYTVDNSESNAPSKLWYFHHLGQNFRECLKTTLSDYTTFVSLAVEQIDATLEEMKCLHPQDESVILCTSVDSRLIDRAGMCPVKQTDPALSVGEMLVSRIFSCADFTRTEQGFSKADTLEQFQTLCKKYCFREEKNYHYCYNEHIMVADICLEENVLKRFKLIGFYLELVSEVGCFGEGRRLATVLHTIYSMSNNSTAERARLLGCLMSNLPGKNVSMEAYDYYLELPGIKQCFLDAVPSNMAFQTVVLQIVQEIMDKMKCLQQTDGKIVLCKDIQ